MLHRRLGILLLLGLLCFSMGALALEPPLYSGLVTTLSLESTPAWGGPGDFVTRRIVFSTEDGQVMRESIDDDTGERLSRETLFVEPEQVADLVETVMPGLLTPPVKDGGEVLDGYYIYISVRFVDGYTMTFGGHCADIIGPEGFAQAVQAMEELADQAVEAPRE